MTDADLIAKKLAFIETVVEQLRRLARPQAIHEDIKEERFVIHTLQLAIQAALDTASHVASSERLGEPAANRQLFELLVADGWLAQESAASLAEMAGFRNLVVHGYQAIDLRIVEDIVAHRLDDLLGFCASIRARLDAPLG